MDRGPAPVDGLDDRSPRSTRDRRRRGQPPADEDGPFDEGDFVLLWGGGLYQWLDPVTLVEGVAAIDDPTVKAFVLAGAHPTPAVPAMEMAARARSRAEELGVQPGTQGANLNDLIAYPQV